MVSSILLRSACGRFHPVFFPFLPFPCGIEAIEKFESWWKPETHSADMLSYSYFWRGEPTISAGLSHRKKEPRPIWGTGALFCLLEGYFELRCSRLPSSEFCADVVSLELSARWTMPFSNTVIATFCFLAS